MVKILSGFETKYSLSIVLALEKVCTLAMALSIEANELLESFLWKNAEEANLEKVKEELADVFAYALLITAHYNLDVNQIVRDKVAKNAEKSTIKNLTIKIAHAKR